MPITSRDLPVGRRLVGRYKGKDYICEVVATGDPASPVAYRVGDQTFKSPSSAGGHVVGTACNGWRFWSLEGEAPAIRKPATAKAPAKKKGGAKKSAKKKANGKAPAKDEYGCGLCSETFTTLKAATDHTRAHSGA